MRHAGAALFKALVVIVLMAGLGCTRQQDKPAAPPEAPKAQQQACVGLGCEKKECVGLGCEGKKCIGLGCEKPDSGPKTN